MPSVGRVNLRHQPKTRDVATRLLGMARELGPEAKLPTVAQLSVDLQVSRDTLNNALADLERRDVIRRVHGNGIFVSPRLRRRTVGVVYAVNGTSGSPFWDMVVEYARKRAAMEHLAFKLYLGAPDDELGAPLPEDLVEAIQAERINGVLFLGKPTDSATAWLEQNQLPVVSFANPTGKYQVIIRNETMPPKAVNELARQGCSRIGLWMPYGLWQRRGLSESSYPLLCNFKQTLQNQGLRYEPRWSWRIDDALESGCRLSLQEQGYLAVQELLSEEAEQPKPDGIAVTNDLMARGVLVALQRMGLRLGVDIKVATQSNRGSNMLLGYEEVVTRLEVDPAQVVSELFILLEKLMDGEEPAEPRVMLEHVVR